MRFILLFLLFVLSLTSCVKVYVGHDPFGASDYFLKGNVISVTETAYEVRIVSGRATKGRELGTVHYEFNEFGKMTVYQKKSVNAPDIRKEYQYEPFGKILSIKSSQYDNYVPHFNDTGNLLYLEFTETSSRQFCYDTYAYNETGQVVRHFRKCSGLDKERFVMQFDHKYKYRKDGTLEEIERIEGTRLRQVSKYDNEGNLVLFENHNPVTNRFTGSSRYEYTFDNSGNWKTQITIEGNRIVGFAERTMEYYPVEYLPISASHIQKLSVKEFVSVSFQRLFSNKQIARTPQGNMLYVMLSLSFFVYIFLLYRKRKTIFGNFSGRKESEKIWIYNKHPYMNVARIIGFVVVSLFGSVLLILLGGFLVILLFWIAGNIFVALWGLGLIICFGGAIIAAFNALRGRGCGLWIVGIVAFFIGSALANVQPATNTKIIETGIGVFNNLNIVNLFEWAVNLFANYWDVLLVALLIPTILFLTLAVITIFLCWLLIGFEMFVTLLYNISHPCPSCGNWKQPKYIMKNGREYSRTLRPGVYGMLYHKTEYEKLPTMLINGRWKLKRRCTNPNCRVEINPLDYKLGIVGYGTPVHIGIVGNQASGKTHLLVYGLYLLKEQNKSKFVQTDISNNDIDILRKGNIMPTNKTNYRAIQFIYKRKIRKIPYHLFFYDVAGEQFNSAKVDAHEAVTFYKNVKSFVFLIDPIMVDYTGVDADSDFLKWVDEIRKIPKYQNAKYPLISILSSLPNMLSNLGNSPTNIDMNFVCVKTDIDEGFGNYYDNFVINPKTGKPDIKKFVSKTMGLANLVKSAEEFRSISYHAASAIDQNTDNLNNLFTYILKQRGVKI